MVDSGTRIIPPASAHTATIDSSGLAPYPTGRTSRSLRTCLLVVPLETMEWNPLHAPHAIVLTRNGNSHEPSAAANPLNAGHRTASSPPPLHPPTNAPATPKNSAA